MVTKETPVSVLEIPNAAALAVPLKLDIGCGPNPREGFEGVDQHAFDGKVRHVMDVRAHPWPWADDSVDEVWCSHFYEHLDATERVAFVNELWRVMKPGAKATFITPHWCSNRAYGDMTHKWPPVSEMHWYYMKRAWRLSQAPHTDERWNRDGFDCDFDVTWSYGLHPDMATRNQQYQQHALSFWKETAQDMIACLVKPIPSPKLE